MVAPQDEHGKALYDRLWWAVAQHDEAWRALNLLSHGAPVKGTPILLDAIPMLRWSNELSSKKRLMKALIAAGADVNATNEEGQTPLHHAAYVGDLETAKALIAAGAKGGARTKEGCTTLHLMDEPTDDINKSRNLVKVLIAAGADVNAKSLGYEKTVLHRMVPGVGRVELVKDLISAGADVNAKDCDGRTALHIACESADVETVKALIAAGADVKAKDNSGKAPDLNWENIQRRTTPLADAPKNEKQTARKSSKGEKIGSGVDSKIPLPVANGPSESKAGSLGAAAAAGIVGALIGSVIGLDWPALLLLVGTLGVGGFVGAELFHGHGGEDGRMKSARGDSAMRTNRIEPAKDLVSLQTALEKHQEHRTGLLASADISAAAGPLSAPTHRVTRERSKPTLDV